MTAAILVVAALVVVPGVGASLAFAPPGAISIESRIALAFGLGYVLAAGVATLLALAHVFFRPTFVAGVVLAAVAAWALALRRGSPRAHASALLAQARDAPVSLAAGLALLLAVAVVWSLRPAALNLAHRPAWRYWADGLELAASGHVPAQTNQWGMEIPTTVNKVVLNAFEGGVSFVLGPDPLQGMHAILVVVAVGLVAALLALGRELGLKIFALLVPALTVLVPKSLPFTHEMANDVTRYIAENVGRMAAFCAVLTGVYALRTRQGRSAAVVTGVLLAVAGLTHGVPTLIAGVMLTLYALAVLLIDASARRRTMTGGAVIVAVFGFCYVGVVGLSGGDLAFQRAGGAALTGFPPDVDPTRSFTHGRLLPHRQADGHFLISPRAMLRGYAEKTVGRPGAALLAVLGLAVLALATAMVVLRSRRFLPLATVAWGLLGTILGVAFLFSYRYDTLIPGVFGVRRFYDYAALVPALLLPAVLEALAGPLIRRARVAAAALAFAAGALAVGGALDARSGHRPSRAAAAGAAVIERVADVVPCDARMLANARTTGTWQATIGRRAITEGMAPFLRPAVLERVLPVLVSANQFFAEPQSNRNFLERENVEYLVVVKPRVWFGWGGSGRGPAEGDAERVASLPDVHTVARDRWVTIFAVGSNARARAGGHPGRCPL